MSVNNQTFHLVYDTLYNITIQLKPDCLSIIFIPHIDILNQTAPSSVYFENIYFLSSKYHHWNLVGIAPTNDHLLKWSVLELKESMNYD
jgi:hypothetical protein